VSDESPSQKLLNVSAALASEVSTQVSAMSSAAAEALNRQMQSVDGSLLSRIKSTPKTEAKEVF